MPIVTMIDAGATAAAAVHPGAPARAGGAAAATIIDPPRPNRETISALEILYRALLDRDPDPTGLAHYASTAARHDLPVRFGQHFAVRRRARAAVVDEHHTVADEHLVLDGHALADEGVRRNFAARAHAGVLLDFYKRPDLRVIADLAAVEVYKRGVENLNVAAEFDAGCDGHGMFRES